MYVIGIDIGTGSTKAVALDQAGNVLVSAQAPYPTINSVPGISEQDPQTVWLAFIKCINRITTSLTEAPSAICLSSAMHSLMCVDNEGAALSNMITWADSRSADIASHLQNTALGKKIYEETGTPVHAMSPLCKIKWLQENNPDLFQRTKKFISIKEYCWFRMFATFEVDYSIASATGLFNITSRKWNATSLGFLGIDESKLSKPVKTNWKRSDVNTQASTLLNIPAGTAVVIGGSDGCLANVGSFATEPGIAALTIGTSGAIRVAGNAPVVNSSSMPFNYLLNENIFISGGPINNGGVALKWYAEALLKKQLNTIEDYNQLLLPVESVPAGCNGLVFLPYILGERAPIWNSDTCGLFFGITAQHRQEHFTRAVLEGITFALYQIARSLEDGGLDIREVHVSGGFVRSKQWVQLLCNVFGKRICLMNIDDASAIGAGLIAMEALGVLHEIEKSSRNEVTIFEPDQDEHALYRQKYFPMYENLYRVLMLEMKIFHENMTDELSVRI